MIIVTNMVRFVKEKSSMGNIAPDGGGYLGC
jgi:hypothetical protein